MAAALKLWRILNELREEGVITIPVPATVWPGYR